MAAAVRRVVSLTAEATPARAGGTVLINDSTAGAIVEPIPMPVSVRAIASTV